MQKLFGTKQDRKIAEALGMLYDREFTIGEAVKTGADLIAERLFREALAGNLTAMKIIFDLLDGNCEAETEAEQDSNAACILAIIDAEPASNSNRFVIESEQQTKTA